MPTVYLWEYWWSCVPFCYTLKEVKSLPQVNKNLFGWKHLNLFCVYLRNHAFPFLWLIKFSGSLFSIFFLHNFSLLQFHWKKSTENDILQLYEHSWRKSSTFTPWTRSSPFSKRLISIHQTQNTKFTRITKCTFIRTTTLHSTTLTALVESSYFPGTCHITTQQPQLYVHRDI